MKFENVCLSYFCYDMFALIIVFTDRERTFYSQIISSSKARKTSFENYEWKIAIVRAVTEDHHEMEGPFLKSRWFLNKRNMFLKKQISDDQHSVQVHHVHSNKLRFLIVILVDQNIVGKSNMK